MERSHLSKLPVELRLQIYGLALKHEGNVVASLCSESPTSQYEGAVHLSTTLVLHMTTSHPLALAQTCSQLRSEALEVFFLVNTFAMALRLSDTVGFARQTTVNCAVDQYIDNIQMFLAEAHDRLGAKGERGRKHVRLDLDLGVLPIRRLEFHGEHKMVACLLKRLRQLGEMYRSTTPIRPRIIVSIGFSWYVAVRDPFVSSQFKERRIGIELDVENGYDSLHEAIEKVKREQSGVIAMDEMMLELDGATDVHLGPHGSDSLSKHSNELSTVPTQAQQAIDVIRMWQEQFACESAVIEPGFP